MDNETLLNDSEFAFYVLGYCWTLHPEIIETCLAMYRPEPKPVQEQVIKAPAKTTTSSKTVLSMFGM